MNGAVVGREYHLYYYVTVNGLRCYKEEVRKTVTPGAAVNDASNLTTITSYRLSPFIQSPLTLHSIQYPDKTYVKYVYSHTEPDLGAPAVITPIRPPGGKGTTRRIFLSG